MGLRAVREGRVAMVDGNAFFNRPGEHHTRPTPLCCAPQP
jgi:hypothetical protein